MGELIDLFLTCIAIYFIYKLIVGLILPVSRAASDMRSKIKEMQQMQEEHIRSQRNTTTAQTSTVKNTSNKEGDYIDFEEVK